MHYPDVEGVKADQVNFAAAYCRNILCDGRPDGCFVIIYDADSRPSLETIRAFAQAIALHRKVDIFHQSSRFEVRGELPKRAGILGPISNALAESSALRANRFVMAYELPRLMRRLTSETLISSYVYTHITGHGLCIRLSFLCDLPLPALTALEDMYYSFIICARNLPMVPVPALDCSEVPRSVGVQFRQLSRWFFGPARFLMYLRDPAVPPGLRSYALAASAAGITVEWLYCGVAVPVLLAGICWGDRGALPLTGVFLVVYTSQLVAVDCYLAPAAPLISRLLRLAAYPFVFMLFGLAGMSGLFQFLRGQSGSGKTERHI